MREAALSHEPGRPAATPRRRRGAAEEDLVVAVVTQHADSVLRLARRVSICDADAQDAYQRGLEIFVKNAGRLEPAKAASWLRTVVKHEALAVRRQRLAAVSREGADLDLHEAAQLVPPEDQVVGFDRLSRSAEALRGLKPDEARALWLRAEGYSYAEIGTTFGWTQTKVNRLLSEGRARFLARYATIEAGGACDAWAPALSAIVDGAADGERRRAVGVHLRSCAGCRATLRELRDSRASVQALFPAGGLVVVAGGDDAAGRLSRLLEAGFAAVHERVAAAAGKLQTAADAVSGGKVAAVTASAAALASGGAVVARDVAPPTPAAHAAHQSEATPTPSGPVSLAAAGPMAVAGPGAAATATAGATTPARTTPRSPRPAGPAAAPEFPGGRRDAEFRASQRSTEFRSGSTDDHRASSPESTSPSGSAAAASSPESTSPSGSAAGSSSGSASSSGSSLGSASSSGPAAGSSLGSPSSGSGPSGSADSASPSASSGSSLPAEADEAAPVASPERPSSSSSPEFTREFP